MGFDQKFHEKTMKFFALRANPTSPTACLPEGWWVRGCASAEENKINFDILLWLLAEFGLAGLVGQVSGPPWLRGNFCRFEFMSAFSLWILSVHFRSSGVPFLGPWGS